MTIISETPTFEQGIALAHLPKITDANGRAWHGLIRFRPQPFGLVSYRIQFTNGSLCASLIGHLSPASEAFEAATNWQRHLRPGRRER